MVFFTDAELSQEGRSTTSASADYMLEALELLCKENHDPQEQTLPKLLCLLPEIRTIASYLCNLHCDINEYADDIKLPYLNAALNKGNEMNIVI